MLPMLRKAGWCIATTYSKTESTKMAYTKIELPDFKDHCNVLTTLSKESSRQRCFASGNIGTTNSCSTLHQKILDEDSVDISGVASKINQEYGINITEEKVAGILSSHRLLSGVEFVGSHASPIQIDPICEDNDVAGLFLILHENSTLISGITEAVAASNVPLNQDYVISAIASEELPPTIEETAQEYHSPIGIMDEELLPPFGVVAEKVSSPIEVVDKKQPYQGVLLEHDATPNLNDTTRTTMQKLDQKW